MKKKNRFLQNKTFVVFSVLALCIIFAAIFAPVITGGVDPLKGSLMDALLPPCKEHIFGTDKMGRDIFTRVIYGARASLTATFGVVALIFLIGSVMGIISGYFGGIVGCCYHANCRHDACLPGTGTGACSSRHHGSQH